MTPPRRQTRAMMQQQEQPQQSQKQEEIEEEESNIGHHRHCRRKREFQALHSEMELMRHGVSVDGQMRRKMNRTQMIQRTKLRKQLEQQDDDKFWKNCVNKQDPRPMEERIRGSSAAIKESVIQKSFIVAATTTRKPYEQQQQQPLTGTTKGTDLLQDKSDDSEEEEEEEEEEEQNENMDESEEDNDEDEENDDVDDDDDDDDGDGDDAVQDEVAQILDLDESNGAATHAEIENISTQQKRASKMSKSSSRPNKRRLLKRLRNFRSSKMAEKHGDALGEHARGKPGSAIRKLKEVAQQAPSAPQIYSSLGMVYEDMLRQSQQKQQERNTNGHNNSPSTKPSENGHIVESVSARHPSQMDGETNVSNEQEDAEERHLWQQLDLAQKAYGSYHAAAILCKQDYTLWLRAGDAALEIADLYTTAMTLSHQSKHILNSYRTDKLYWLEEAKSDYQTADNLNPPGIDIQAKLASVMIQIGHLSEALTLLTDLKDNPDFNSYRAWLLYADTMLRIGYECTQWKRGIQKNSSFMFRRWLRKFANSFDWQERRLQALVMAMEAACGTKCSISLLEWLQQHVDKTSERISNTNNDDIHTQITTDETINQNLTSTNTDLESKKNLLMRRNSKELEAFDKTTEALRVEHDTPDGKTRHQARMDLIQRHKFSLLTLVGQCQTRDSDKILSHQTKTISIDRDLPISASISTVCAIASEVLRQMLSMSCFDGGEVLAKSVSLYLKERAYLRDKRIESKRGSTPPDEDNFFNIFAMSQEPYDVADMDDDESVVVISDDDDLDADDQEAVLSQLRNGTLPPEILLLYGLCLAGEGSKAFLASKCIKAIEELPNEPTTWLTEQNLDTNVSPDASWLLLQVSMTGLLGRTAAFALVVDALLTSGRESDVAKHLTEIFHEHIVALSENGMIKLALDTNYRKDPVLRSRQNQVIRVLVAGTKYRLQSTEALTVQNNRFVDVGSALSTLLDAVELLTKVLPVLWKVERDGSISAVCGEMIQCLDHTLYLFSRCVEQLQIHSEDGKVKAVFSKIAELVSVISGVPLLIDASIQSPSVDWNSIPFSSVWLAPDMYSLSLRTLNVCVGTNISLFSGWEKEEFSVRLLRGSAHNFFGVEVDAGQVAGYVSEKNEEELSMQWRIVKDYFVDSLAFDFGLKLQGLRETQWYKDSRRRYSATEEKYRIVYFAEDHALSALLYFSRVCLSIASRNRVSDAVIDKPFYIALSILLPISQFCLNELVWDACLGREISAATSFHGPWRDFSTCEKQTPIIPPSERPGYIRPSRKALLSAAAEKRDETELQTWFEWENDSDFLSNLLALPLPFLGKEWRRTRKEMNDSNSTNSELMNRFDCSIRKLRRSHTTLAVEKASLRIASELIVLATCPDCCNPFVCLQQAAMFASQAPKGGTSDCVFQERLPQTYDCTSLEAIKIIGRADCLLAVYFFQEAAFLCNFVALVCCVHRDARTRQQNDVQWRIVASITYDLSVRIRTFSKAIMAQRGTNDDTSGTWDCAAIEELRYARAEGLNWKSMKAKTLNKKNEHEYRSSSEIIPTKQGPKDVVLVSIDEATQKSLDVTQRDVPDSESLRSRSTSPIPDDSDINPFKTTKIYAV